MGETFFALTGLAMFQGETYAQGNKAQMEHSRSFFQTLAFNDKVVLDCGCGDGRATLEFVGSQNVKKLYAFDPSESQIETARQRVVGKDNVSFFTAGFDNFLDVECGGVLQDEVDVVISNFALHLAPSRAAAFRNIYTVLKPGGEFHAVYPSHCSFLSRMLRELEQDERFGDYIRQMPIHDKNPNGVVRGNEDTEQYPTHIICTFKLLMAAGFSCNTIRVTDRVGVIKFETEVDVERFVAGINMHRNLIPEELRPEFDKAAAFELRKTPYFVGSDRLTMLSPAIEMRAYKEKPKKEVAHDESFIE